MKISVLGCGWLGFPLAQQLLEESFQVKGSTTTESKISILKQSGIEPYLMTLPDSLSNPEIDEFWNAGILFLNIPPSRTSNESDGSYPDLIEKIVQKAEEHAIKWIIFASSTSVYSKYGGVTTEEDAVPGKATRASGEAILKAESILQECPIDSTILRFGGLYGYDRHPVHYLSGKKDLSDATKPVNLIHQSDCIGVVLKVIKLNKRNEIYNVVSDGHPPKKEFYQSAAMHFDLPLPKFSGSNGQSYKIISNEKLKKDLNYSFDYPNPMDHTP